MSIVFASPVLEQLCSCHGAMLVVMIIMGQLAGTEPQKIRYEVLSVCQYIDILNI